jgi:hypothetical protein
VAAFELTQMRALLLIFPNTFEYFFIFCELVRSRWSTSRMGPKTVVIAAVSIWALIKLPQEWWIHIAQLDMTSFAKERLFGVATDSSWMAAISARPSVLMAAALCFLALGALLWWIVARKAPAADHRAFRLAADPLPDGLRGAELYRTARTQSRILDSALAEKAVLLSLVCVIFATMNPTLEGHSLRVAVSVALFVALNAVVSQWLARRGHGWRTVAVELGVVAVMNFGLVMVQGAGAGVLGFRDSPLPSTLFFVFLLTVNIVLFDRYRTVYVARRALSSSEQNSSGE